VDDFLKTEIGQDGSIILSECQDAKERLAELKRDTRRTNPDNENGDVLLQVKKLKVHFQSGGNFLGDPPKIVKAVDGVDFQIQRGRTLGLVGESGCGKTTLGRAILKLQKTKLGSVLYDGNELITLTQKEMLDFRKRMQIIFQDPYASLNPRQTIEQTLVEPLLVHGIGVNHSERKDRIVSLLEEVGLGAEFLLRYPHEFSGGQRQRISVARALAVEPEFIVCDECVSAMDVSVQAQVLNLLRELQQKRNLTYLFISHDLSVVKFMSDDMIVMKNGKIMESGNAQDIYENPKSNYTRELLDAVPSAALTG
jgi:peptide/nickel transport system ATP-binding protein